MKRLIAFMLLLTVLFLPSTLWATDPFKGTWILNVSKSKFPSAFLEALRISGPKQETIVIRELDDDKLEAIVTGKYIDGSQNFQRQTVPKQGGIVKFQQGGPTNGSYYVETKISEKEKYRTLLENGKQSIVLHILISQDGKEMKITITDTNNQGKPLEGLYLFERQ